MASERKRNGENHPTAQKLCRELADGLTAAAQVGLDQQPRIVVEPGAIDLHVLDNALHVIARLRERDALDPVDRIDLRIARIAVLLDPFFRPPRAGIVGDEGQNIGAAPAGDVIAEFGGAELGVVGDVGHQPVLIERDVEPLGGVAAGRRRDLHQADGVGAGHDLGG